jgi:uncharacterized membrane protein
MADYHCLIRRRADDHAERAIRWTGDVWRNGAVSDEHGSPDGATDGTQRRLSSPDRIVAFSDGVFVIIITILVLEIAVPENLSERSLLEALGDLQSTFVAWVISFLLTGMFWVAHRDLFARVRIANRDLVWLNLLFLLPVSLIPFAASLLGRYPDDPVAMHLYGAVLVAATLMRFVLYRYVVKRPTLLSADVSTDRAGLGLAITAAPIALYLLAIALPTCRQRSARSCTSPSWFCTSSSSRREHPSTRSEADEFT